MICTSDNGNYTVFGHKNSTERWVLRKLAYGIAMTKA